MYDVDADTTNSPATAASRKTTMPSAGGPRTTEPRPRQQPQPRRRAPCTGPSLSNSARVVTPVDADTEIARTATPVSANGSNSGPGERRRPVRRRHEARTAQERRALGLAALRAELPGSLEDECDFEKFVDGSRAVIEYIDSVFACATDRQLPSGAFADPPEDAEECDRLCDDMLRLARAFNEYWMEHAEEMLTETDLSADDASVDRLPTGLVAMTVVGLAESTAAALGAFPAFETATAMSFGSVSRQLLAQTAKPIRSYGPRDLVRAVEAICHAWQRIRIDQDVFAYIRALRLRFGIMLRCAHAHAPGDPPIPAEDKQCMTDPFVGDDGTEYRLPTMEFREELTHRFRALADSMWIFERHGPPWTRESLSIALKRVALEREQDTRSASRRRRKRRRVSETEPDLVDEEEDGNADIAIMDTEQAVANVADLLRKYSAAVSGSGAISQQYRSKFMEFMVCPGDDGAFRTRNPNMNPSTKNVVKTCRGSKFFSAAADKATIEAHDLLRVAAVRLAKEVGTGLAEAALSRDGAEPTETRMNDRSRAMLQEEIAAICAFDCLLKGRFNVAWRERFVIAKSTYRTAAELDMLKPGALPVVLVSANAFDVIYEGRLMRTSSVFEAIAWWLECVRLAHGSELPTNVAMFKGVLAAKAERQRALSRGEEGDAGDYDEEEDDEDDADEPDANDENMPDAEDGSAEDATIVYGDDPDERAAAMSELLRKKACRIDLTALCSVPLLGADTMNFRTDHRQVCRAVPVPATETVHPDSQQQSPRPPSAPLLPEELPQRSPSSSARPPSVLMVTF